MYYKIVRSYLHGGKRTIRRGLTLEMAQEYCRSPETSSKTCTTAKARAVTRRVGQWFDGYEEDPTAARFASLGINIF